MLIGAALAAAMSVGGGAAAQGAEDDVAWQRKLFAEGNALYDKKLWDKALEKYEAAWKLRRGYDLAANLGDVELKSGKPRDAAEHLAYALREFPAGGKPALRDAVTKLSEEARRQVGTLRIAVSRPGAEVLVDGRVIGYAPLAEEVFVEPGARVIEARLEGYAAARETITAGKGAQHEVKLTLVREAGVDAAAQVAPVPPEEGAASVKDTPMAPARSAELSASAAVPSDGRRWILVGVGGAAAAALVGVGAVFTAVAAGKASDADAQQATLARGGAGACGGAGAPATCGELQSLNDASDTFQGLGMAAFVGAGVVGAATAVYALWPRRQAAAQAVRVVPVGGIGGGGVVIGGRF